VKLLLVEDSVSLAATLVLGLTEDGHQVEQVATGAAALTVAARREIDAIVLDLGLPDLDGVDVIERLRATGDRVPVLVLTARDAVASRIAALDAGADDYLGKPFAFGELLARLRALARRAAGPRRASLTVGALVVADDLSCTVAGRRVELSPRQHALLAYLTRRRGEVVTRPEILREVFGYGFDPGTNLLDVHLNHLRRKLGAGPVRIETIRSVGIRLEVEG